jgi:hypothetical protein
MFRASLPIFNGAPKASRYFATRAAVTFGSTAVTVIDAVEFSAFDERFLMPGESSASRTDVSAFELTELIDELIFFSLFVLHTDLRQFSEELES